jgi:hypothetical protein
VPTQKFFTEDFGMPLYMEPNFEDLSCNMIFGTPPPDLKDDPVSTQPCFSSCALTTSASASCAAYSAPLHHCVPVDIALILALHLAVGVQVPLG